MKHLGTSLLAIVSLSTLLILTQRPAHADRDELLKFAESCLPNTKTFFTALGEPESERFLAQRIHDFIGGNAIVPAKDAVWEITKTGAKKI